MRFGKRGLGMGAAPGAPRLASRPANPRLGGYRLALFYAAGGYAASALAAPAWAVAHDHVAITRVPELTALVVLLAGPVVMTAYAVTLLIVDVLFRRLEVASRIAYAGAGAALPVALFMLGFAITGGLRSWFWVVFLVAPGGLAGGYALGRNRKPPSQAEVF